MKKLLMFCAALLPFIVSAERITNFAVTIDMQQDGSIMVRETIEYDFESNQKRGIYRTIPTRFTVEKDQRLIEIENVEVKRNQKEDGLKVSHNNQQIKIRIGEPEVYINGQHRYDISYRVRGALRYFDDFDELYWNVTGDQWEVPIDQVVANVVLPSGVETLQQSCYRGRQGSTQDCGQAGKNTQVLVKNLEPSEGVTMALGFTPDVVDEVVLLAPGHNSYAYGVLAVIAFLYSRFVWRLNRRHYKKQSIITQYDAPDGFSAMFSGYVIDGQLQGRDIAAGVIELAQQGYITIIQKGSDTWLSNYNYDLVLNKKTFSDLTPAQRYLLQLFFDDPLQVGGTYNTKTGKKITAENVGALSTKCDSRRMQLGIREQAVFPIKVCLWVCVAMGAVLFWIFHCDVTNVALYVVWAIISLVVFATAGAGVYRYTLKGYQTIDHLKGLYRYIDVAEQSRIDFHDAPEKNPETFSRYLPFAVAFGLEKQWIKEFADIMEPQDWLRDTTGQVINPAGVATAVSSVNTALVSQVSLSSSGSSGGGFSGGGAGGGGGGSW